jgi:signal transduction histidine kinase
VTGDGRDDRTAAVLLAGCAVAALFALLPAGDARNAVRVALTVALGVAVAVAVRRRRPPYPLPWWLLAGAMWSAAAGETLVGWYAQTSGGVRFPSLADAFFLLCDALVGVAVYLVTTHRQPARARGALVEGLVVTAAVALVVGVYVIEPAARSASLTRTQQTMLTVYPSIDLLVAVVAARLVFAAGVRHRASVLIAGGTACALLADITMSVDTVDGPYPVGAPAEAVWLVAFLLFAVAAWDARMADATEPDAGEARTPFRARVAVLGVAAMAPIVVSLAPAANRVEVRSIAATSAVLMLLVLVRLYESTSDLAAMRAETDRTHHAEELARRQTQFATMAAHELRTPLTSLRGSLTTLARGALPEEHREELLAIALRQSDRLARLVADLDVVVQSENGGLPVVAEPVDVGAIAREAVSSLGADAAARVRVDAGDVRAIADAGRLAQVFVNLVRNALQYTSGAVVVSAANAGGSVVVDVADEGPGLEPEVAGAAFERFGLRDSAATGGFGVGLWIVRELTTAMGGSVSYGTRPGGGAVFTVTLPGA